MIQPADPGPPDIALKDMAFSGYFESSGPWKSSETCGRRLESSRESAIAFRLTISLACFESSEILKQVNRAALIELVFGVTGRGHRCSDLINSSFAPQRTISLPAADPRPGRSGV